MSVEVTTIIFIVFHGSRDTDKIALELFFPGDFNMRVETGCYGDMSE